MTETMKDYIDPNWLVKNLSLEEKISLLAGADGWQTQQIERLGIGSVKTTDGPAGARGSCASDGPKAAFVPSPMCQAASWSKDQLRNIGRLLSKEAQTKEAQVLLAPTVCMVRNPLGGRNFESFGEDPYLTGTLAEQYIAGVQESGLVSATPKHFVANEQEFERFTTDAHVDEKSLREIYLKPFEMVVRSETTQPWCLMTSYNLVNGVHADMNEFLVTKVLREEWGFRGLVMSDWGGTNSTEESVLAGVDLEMPGPPERRGKRLVEAAENNPKVVDAVNQSAQRVLTLAERFGLLGMTPDAASKTRQNKELTSSDPADVRIMRSVAADGVVLLKNDHNTLPLKPSLLQGATVAFIGPNAKTGAVGGGGSAAMNPQYLSHPMASFQAAANELKISIQTTFATGDYSNKFLPLLSADQWCALDATQPKSKADTKSMIRMDFYRSIDCSGPILETQYRDSSTVELFDTAPQALLEGPVPPYSYRISSVLTPRTTGTHSFGVASIGNSRVKVDDKIVVENIDWKEKGECFSAFSSKEVVGTAHLQAGKQYNVVVEGWTRDTTSLSELDHVFAAQPSIRFGYLEELPGGLVDDAVALADQSDYAVVVLGLDDAWESEGYDRQTMALPGKQDALATALLTGCKHPERLIFVVQSGSAVELPWADKAGTLLQAWYGGQEAGNGLADVLLGTVHPSGRMPVTWPRRYEDLPFAASPDTWPGVDGKVVYKEGQQIGYRYYLQNAVEPRFWFGYGLSYTVFDTTMQDAAQVRVAGWSIAQFQTLGKATARKWYNSMPGRQVTLKKKILAAFDKTQSLAPGQTENIHLQVKARDIASWDEGHWVLSQGVWAFGIGAHAGDHNMKTVEIEIASDKNMVS